MYVHRNFITGCVYLQKCDMSRNLAWQWNDTRKGCQYKKKDAEPFRNILDELLCVMRNLLLIILNNIVWKKKIKAL